MKIKILRITSALLLVLLMLSIFMLSSQTAAVSSQTSGGFTYRLFSVIIPGFADKSLAEQMQMIESASFAVRKAAHFSAYAAMGILSFLTFVSYKKLRFKLRCGISYAVCVLYAISDEIHQYFVAGRSCEIRDVLIDSFGALLGLLICLAVVFIRNKKVRG